MLKLTLLNLNKAILKYTNRIRYLRQSGLIEILFVGRLSQIKRVGENPAGPRKKYLLSWCLVLWEGAVASFFRQREQILSSPVLPLTILSHFKTRYTPTQKTRHYPLVINLEICIPPSSSCYFFLGEQQQSQIQEFDQFEFCNMLEYENV